MTIKFTIIGEPASKANSRQIVRFGDRSAIIKSKKGRDYERDATLQIPDHAKQMLQGPVRMTLRIFYASERPDLDESIILDVLQAKYKTIETGYEKVACGEFVAKTERKCVRRGCYMNDRQVRERHVYHGVDKANPRAEIEIELLAPGLFAADQAPVVIQPKAREELPARPF